MATTRRAASRSPSEDEPGKDRSGKDRPGKDWPGKGRPGQDGPGSAAARRPTPAPATDESAAADADGVRRVPGDYGALVELFADASPVSMSHWNVETGERFSAPAGKRRRDAAEAFESRLFAEEGWIEVPHQESDDAFAMARAFADGLQPGKGRAAVLAALEQPKPFRQLRQVVAAMPGIARRWRKVQLQEAEVRLVELCIGLEIELADPRFAAARARFEAAQAETEADLGELLPRAPAIPPPVRRPVASLSLGRPAPDAE